MEKYWKGNKLWNVCKLRWVGSEIKMWDKSAGKFIRDYNMDNVDNMELKAWIWIQNVVNLHLNDFYYGSFVKIILSQGIWLTGFLRASNYKVY